MFVSENAHDLISVHVFTKKGGYHVNYPSNIFANREKKYSRTPYHLLRGIFNFQCSLQRLYEQTIESFILQQQQNAVACVNLLTRKSD